jgi:hypothetical protein
MGIADYKSLGVAGIIMDRRRPPAKSKSKDKSGLWSKKCASAKQIERSLARVRG